MVGLKLLADADEQDAARLLSPTGLRLAPDLFEVHDAERVVEGYDLDQLLLATGAERPVEVTVGLGAVYADVLARQISSLVVLDRQVVVVAPVHGERRLSGSGRYHLLRVVEAVLYSLTGALYRGSGPIEAGRSARSRACGTIAIAHEHRLDDLSDGLFFRVVA